MDRNAIKKFATWARIDLIERVSQKSLEYGIDRNGYEENIRSYDNKIFSDNEFEQRNALVNRIKSIGYEQTMEEVAYTWFNRFTALRFMEVNGYLPSKIRVFTDEGNNFKPQILTEAIYMDSSDVDKKTIYTYKEQNDNEGLFRYLIINQCNLMSKILPGMFQEIENHTEILFPDNLLRNGSVIEQLVTNIPAEDFDVNAGGQVEIMGWMYQYYNTDLFNSIYDGDKSRKSLTSDDLPAATQLFTPDFAVRYMVENSLGKLWMIGHPESNLVNGWKYYLREPNQNANSIDALNKINSQYKNIEPSKIKCLDPCMGSGHMLVYMFDLLIQIYESYGYSLRDSVASILQNNIYGFDIDERAAQMAYFAVMMKARQYDKRFFARNIQPNVYVIKDNKGFDSHFLEYFADGNEVLKENVEMLLDAFSNAKDLGSIIKIPNINFDIIENRIMETNKQISIYAGVIQKYFVPLVWQAKLMSQKYDVVITNPPYLGSPRMGKVLSDYIKLYYSEGKADLSTVMYLSVAKNYLKRNGFVSFITTNSWMFLKSFLKIREWSLENLTFDSIVDYGTELFEGKIGHLPIVAWVSRNANIEKNFSAIRLVDYKYGRRDEKLKEFFEERNHFVSSQNEFEAIDGKPIVYWISENILKSFEYEKLGDFVEIVSGMTTGNNDKYLRLWQEINVDEISFGKTELSDVNLSKTKWFPYHKGGEQRKWYGNHEYIVDWSKKDEFNRAKTTMTHVYLKPCITWSDISGNSFAGRYCYGGFMFDVKGSCAFGDKNDLDLLIALFNSKIMPKYVEALNPTSTTQVGDLKRVPLIRPTEVQCQNINSFVEVCVETSKEEWDSFEFSWDFQTHPLTPQYYGSAIVSGKIADYFSEWSHLCDERIERVRKAEENINKILVDIYGLENEIDVIVTKEEVTLREADCFREVRSLISYAIGCMFGRYSLDKKGIVCTSTQLNMDNYKTFKLDNDNIIPICDDEYFMDDLVHRFIEFIEIVYGKETRNENLSYIAKALDCNTGSPIETLRSYFLNYFYADHLKIYQKRPIYWKFSSGKKDGFNALMYIHRYQQDTLARLRTDYVHELQARYRTTSMNLKESMSRMTTSEKVKENRRLIKIQEQEIEISTFEEKLHHLADQMIKVNIDEGIVNNYTLFSEILAQIK